MKRYAMYVVIIVWTVAFLVVGSLSFAADVTLTWDAVAGATGYKLYMSTDQGVSWDPGTDVGDVTTYAVAGVVEDRLVMWRASAYNASNEAIRFEAGVWYDHRLKPVNPTGGLGIK